MTIEEAYSNNISSLSRISYKDTTTTKIFDWNLLYLMGLTIHLQKILKGFAICQIMCAFRALTH